MIKTIYVTTPCMNVADTIDRTIMSVLSQAGDFYIRYHIQDGGSTDGTVARLLWWQFQLAASNFPLQCLGVDFTYTSEPDTGMYDALFKGLAATQATPERFMTWINGDDMFMPGAFDFVANVDKQFSADQISWVGGAVSIFLGNLPNSTFDRPIPRAAIQAGLCDGTHWDFVQQEGTFFRKSLWDAIDPNKTIRPLRLAGDWNLWRLFAKKASLVQARFPLGTFRIRPQQLSDRLRDEYLSEIEALVPAGDRRQALKDLADSGSVYRRVFQLNYKQKTMAVIDELQNSTLRTRYQKVFDKPIELAGDAPSTKKVFQGASADTPLVTHRRDVISADRNILAFDANWQFPAITEQHAFNCIRDSNFVPVGMTYVAYPWANLIDKLQANAPDKIDHLLWFRDFCRQIPKSSIKVTVCQHIKMKDFLHLFDEAGISVVFWTHATFADTTITKCQSPTLFPFPLYPVQVPKALPTSGPEADGMLRKYLFSFIGARANQYYLTEARNWILDLLKDDPRGLIIGRGGWHYEHVVYDHQIKGSAESASAESLVDTSSSVQFLESLKQSTFSLCPSGSGPNSIRLWESIGAGSIPVILADTWAPPGNQRLWEMAAVFCKEDPEEIKALPDRLAKIAADPEQLVSMRHAMRQLWLLYGPQSFVTDVQEFILSHTDGIGSRLTKSVSGYSTGTLIEEALNLNLGAELLRHCASALLLDPLEFLERLEKNARLAMAIESARTAQSRDSALVQHFDAVLDRAKRKSQKSSPSAPAVVRNAAPKICLFGRHGNRTPLSYEPIRRVIGSRLEFVENPIQADLIVSGFNIDFRDNIDTLLPVLKSTHKPKLAVISEEPLWDITWSGPFRGKTGQIFAKETEINYTFLGHETSDIFDFKRIPYFLLTSNSYPVRYANMISRFAKLSPKEMSDRWAKATIPAAFFMEKRKGEAYSAVFPERDVAALSAYRTSVAECMETPGVVRSGKGWNNESRRQDLPDWHLDKLARLDGQTRILSAFENVHQRNYITEKIFDAFAVGAVPVYWASPKHRIFDLISDQSFLNSYTQNPQESADMIMSFTPDQAFAEAWLVSAVRLVEIFSDAARIQEERRRVVQSALQSIFSIL